MRRLLIVGAGGHGRSVAEAVLASDQFKLVGFLDDAFPGLSQVGDFPVLGGIADFSSLLDCADAAIVAIGNNQLRKEVCTRLRNVGLELATIVHPRAIVSPTAIVYAGSAIMAGAIVGTEAVLGEGVIVNCGAVVDHHCKVEDFGHLGVNAAMAGGSTLGESAWMQAGSTLGYNVKINAWQVLAPGEAVNKC
jgi:sugar O-acyltransferase (sialic acid O-acetyltransferase NeuD family)